MLSSISVEGMLNIALLDPPPFLQRSNSNDVQHDQPRRPDHQTHATPHLHSDEIRASVFLPQQRTRDGRSDERGYTRHTP